MPFAPRFSELIHTLRFRLTAWITLVVSLMVIVTMATVRAVVLERLQFEFDQVLLVNTKDITPSLHQHYPDQPAMLATELDGKLLLHPDRDWFVEVYDPATGFRWASANLPSSLPAPSARGDSLRRFDHGAYRILEAPAGVPLAEGQPRLPLYVRSGCLREPLTDDVALVNRIMLLASSLVILLAPLGGFILAGRATQPIARIISTAARLQPSKLDERLPLRGTGDELDQLSQTINGMLDRIASYIGRTQQFVADAAHELRSPLAAIRSTVEVGLNQGRSPEEYAALLSDVMEECTRLSNLVNRLLILAEGDAGLLAARDQSVQLDKIVRESLDMFEAVAEAQGVELQATELAALVVPGDEHHLRQVVRNLIDNAIKFSCTPGVVQVALQSDPLRRQAVLTIQDQGPGVPAEMQAHIFERFYRIDKSRNRLSRRSGTGLGLAICRSIVTALHGEIALVSEPDAGSTFTVRLPLLDEPVALPDKPLATASKS